jgi:hypothetical protein
MKYLTTAFGSLPELEAVGRDFDFATLNPLTWFHDAVDGFGTADSTFSVPVGLGHCGDFSV